MSLSKDVEELQRKAGSYDLLLEEYNRLKDAIKESLEKLSSVLGDMTLLKKDTSKRTGIFSNTINMFYQRLKTEDGFQLTSTDVENYLESKALDTSRNHDIFYHIGKMPDIEKTKVNKKVTLFLQKKI